jgi:CRISPR/Cas system-associated exonuclease Cas4 (RecB family)
MKISYTDYRTYLDCPRLYRKKTDKVEPPEKESRYFTLYGLLVEKFFERYTNRISKTGRVLKDEEVRYLLGEMWKIVLDENYVVWDDPWAKRTADDIFEMAYQDVLENMRKFTFWKNSQSEVPFRINLKKSGDVITCRMDFIHKASDGTVEIIDGKGKMKIDKDADLEQLYFYALVYLLRNGRLPNKIGFLYYRFKLIKYIDFDADTILAFRDKVALVKNLMKKDTEFRPKVMLSKQCKWCPYKYDCDAYRTKKEASAKKRHKGIEGWSGQTVELDL